VEYWLKLKTAVEQQILMSGGGGTSNSNSHSQSRQSSDHEDLNGGKASSVADDFILLPLSPIAFKSQNY
jgi:hypothetical protein